MDFSLFLGECRAKRFRCIISESEKHRDYPIQPNDDEAEESTASRYKS